ncbi:MAG: glucose-1-phosphate adenylyltransferase [Verrucomicrobiales bacterium]|nr:glucose-1-phosphate adenylyltransferase [Verrucomicrobiales bacterium]
MSPTGTPRDISERTLSIIMGGGQGTRLFPLTRERAKPAVPLAGKYRLVDIPLSNCINSGLKRIYLLTQFNSASLHRHISQSYTFDHFSGGFVGILAAEQTFSSTSWYQGTADAVRKNITHFLNHSFDYALILSGDQLYRMNFRAMLVQHEASRADLTIATIPVARSEASSLGIMQIDGERRITRFVEKPKDADTLDSLRLTPELKKTFDVSGEGDQYLASMGIYVFNRDFLLRLLKNDLTDFGKHIIPSTIGRDRVFSHVFQGYWEDIGTIRSFFEANVDLTSELPRFNFFDMEHPIFTRPRFLPASKINGGTVDHAVISDGCIITRACIRDSTIGVRSLICDGAELNRVIVMGNDYYESGESIRENREAGRPPVGIGPGTRIDNAIIDKNARIGANCVLTPAGKPENSDHPLYYIRDGVLIVPKNGVIPDNPVT